MISLFLPTLTAFLFLIHPYPLKVLLGPFLLRHILTCHSALHGLKKKQFLYDTPSLPFSSLTFPSISVHHTLSPAVFPSILMSGTLSLPCADSPPYSRHLVASLLSDCHHVHTPPTRHTLIHMIKNQRKYFKTARRTHHSLHSDFVL